MNPVTSDALRNPADLAESASDQRRNVEKWHHPSGGNPCLKPDHQGPPMYDLGDITPYGYADTYEACLAAGWTQPALDAHLARASTRAGSRAYMKAVVDAALREVPPAQTTTTTTVVNATSSSGDGSIATASHNLTAHGIGRRIPAHPYTTSDGTYCDTCQLPRANRLHPQWTP